MRRRKFIAGAVSLAATSPALAQKQVIRVIGLLSPFTRAETEPWHEAFRQGLGKFGWSDGGSARLEYRYCDGHDERLPEIVAALVELKPDGIAAAVHTDGQPASHV